MAMHEDLVDGHSFPCISGEHDNDNDCAKNPNNANQLDKDGGEDAATHGSLLKQLATAFNSSRDD